MGKLLGGIQIAAGLMALALSGLCGAILLPELTRNPAQFNDPGTMAMLGVVLLIFIGGLASVRQGWRRITGTYVDRRSRTARWVNAIVLLIIGIGWLAMSGLHTVGIFGLGGAGLPAGYWLIMLSQSLPALIFLLIGLRLVYKLVREGDGL
jgi:hypothetical protein